MADPVAIDDGTVELRGMCPKEVVDFIDAYSNVKRITRTEAWNRILLTWARSEAHRHKLYAAALKNNPLLDRTSPEATE